ncbi:MAG: cell division protein FtsQ/DivIB [Terriglobia bacterium]
MFPEEISLADDLLAEEPNPYRRRQKVIGVRRGGAGPVARFVNRVALFVVLPLGLLLTARWAVRRVASSPLLIFQPVQDVQLSGNDVVSRNDVLNAIGLGSTPESLGVSIFRINLDGMRRRVESIPWVESATVARVFPNRLLVTIVERTPIAYANVGGRVELVDKDGVFLQMRRRDNPAFPVLYGLDAADGAGRRRALLAPFEQFAKATKGVVAGSGWQVSEADLSNPEDLRVLLVKGRVTVLAHFGYQDFLERFNTFVAVTPKVLASTPQIDSIDLRFHGEVVVDPEAKTPVGSSVGQR